MARLRALFGTGALVCIVLGGGAVPAAAQQGSRNIVDYIRQPGDQVIDVPDGTYRGGDVSAPHDATDGPYNGWLVLRAETKGGVVVDLADAELYLDRRTSRVLFVGFTFVNGPMTIEGSDIAFWYTDHSFPADVWASQGPAGRPQDGRHQSPDAVHAYATTTKNIAFYGSALHDTGDAIDVSNSTATLLQGVEIFDLSDKDLDPNDVVHPDAIDGVTGSTDGLTVRDSFIRGRIVLEDGGGGRGQGGAHRDVLFERTWVTESPSAGFHFTSNKDEPPNGIFGRRVGVRSWGHNNGRDRLESIDGSRPTQPNTDPQRIDVIDVDVSTDPPPPGTPNPAAVWQSRHPYDGWRTFFEFPADTDDGGSFLEIALFSAVALAVLVVAFVGLRRRRRRPRPRVDGGVDQRAERAVLFSSDR